MEDRDQGRRSGHGFARYMGVGVLLTAVSLVLGSCGGDEDQDVTVREKVFNDDRFAFTFRYPGTLESGTVTEVGVSSGDEAPKAQAALRIDEDNGVVLSKYDLDRAVTRENLADVAVPEMDRLVAALTGNNVTGTAVELDGFLGIRYDDVKLDEPPDGESRLVVLFDDETQYLMNCQSTPHERAAIEEACDRALATLRAASSP